jgi:hypothetical protein
VACSYSAQVCCSNTMRLLLEQNDKEIQEVKEQMADNEEEMKKQMAEKKYKRCCRNLTNYQNKITIIILFNF